MNTFSIIADSPQEAITKARQTFGPEAVIQEVRKQPRTGLSRLWKQPRLELVLAVPAPTSPLSLQIIGPGNALLLLRCVSEAIPFRWNPFQGRFKPCRRKQG